MARWQLSVWLNAKSAVPLGTLAANWVGGLFIGLIAGYLSARPDISPVWRLFWVTGLLGGLTTFSTFSAESVGFLERGQWGLLLAHSGLHLLGSVALAALGFWLMKIR
ncbi:MAG: fluoride efflux transporter CrcB [Candidatus Methylacidiphilales bacterium]